VRNQTAEFQQNVYQTHYILNYSRSWALREEPPIVQPLKKFPACYGTRRFNTVFTKPSTGPYLEPYQSNPLHPISLRSILILPAHLRLGLPSGLSSSGFLTNNAFHFSPFVLHAPPIHPSWLDHSNYYTWRRVQYMKLLIMQFSPTSCHFITLWFKYSRHITLVSETLRALGLLCVVFWELKDNATWASHWSVTLLSMPYSLARIMAHKRNNRQI
jgi:hypothetical protein